MVYVRLKNVNVRIPIYDANSLRLFKRQRRAAGSVGSHEFDSSSGILRVHALTDISMDLSGGDRVALIGHNGAGKSTLLRFMAGIYPSSSGTLETEGNIHLYGGITPINPDASGYENIRLAAELNHLPRTNIEGYLKDVEEFTELGEYLDMPTRIYSAGMVARLSFAIATMHTPEILLIDEGIGAGDAKFANKVRERIDTFTQKASIMVVASHSESLLRKMCNKGAVFEGGHLIFTGTIDEALRFSAERNALAPKAANTASTAA